jgi:MGT family glycosyltransferase
VRVACATWEGGGNLIAFRVLAERLQARGHEVKLRIGWGHPPETEADVLVVDHMSTVDVLEQAKASGMPVAALVHTLWSYVPHLEGTFSPAGWLDVLTSVDRLLVCTVAELDRGATLPANAAYVGPLLETEGPDAGWSPPSRSLVVVSLGTTDMAETPVLQRVLDALAPLPVDVVATVGTHVDRAALHVPANATVTGYLRHAAVLPHADVFVGHGGHGGIMASLAFGVPVVSLPLDRDQPHNAARVEAVGAGRTVAKDASTAEIRDVVESVRTGMREREGAIRMANAIASYGHAPVEAIEALGRAR